MIIGRTAQSGDNAQIWVLIKNMKYKINKQNRKTQDTENTLMIARGDGGWGAEWKTVKGLRSTNS